MIFASLCRAMLILGLCVLAWGVQQLAVRMPGLVIVAVLLAMWLRLHRRTVSDAYGSARTATLGEMIGRNLLGDEGVILGRCDGGSPSLLSGVLVLLNPAVNADAACRMFFACVSGIGLKDRLIRAVNFVHLLTCSPAGGGKSVSTIVPNLLSVRHSCVIIDPKGELFRLTSKHRQKVLGQRIIRLDPFNVCGPGGDTLNPFDFLDPASEEFLDDCQTLANALVIRTADEREPHWNDNAERFIKGLSGYICACEPIAADRTLDVMRLCSSSMPKFKQTLESMQLEDEVASGLIQRLGGQMAMHEGEELAGVLATYNRHTSFLDSPHIARLFGTSTFDPKILRKDRRKATIYLILPAHRLSSHSRVMRLLIAVIMRRITSGTPTERNPVLWFLDEVGHLGRIQAIEDAVTLMRGMGMRLWFFVQSLEQFKTTFGEKAATLLDNISIQQYYGVTSFDTCETLSKRIGETTVATTTVSTQEGHSQNSGPQPSGSTSGGTTINHQEVARRLLKPEELIQLPKWLNLIFVENLPVILGKQVRYYDAPEFRKGWSGRRGTAAARRFGVLELAISSAMLALCCVVSLLASGIVLPVRVVMPTASRLASAPSKPAAAKRPISKLVPTPEALRRRTARNRRGAGASDFLIRID